MYRWLLAAVICLGMRVSHAQSCDYTLKINVVETHSFDPVYPAVVFVERLGKSFETDESGMIQIDSVCSGIYILHFQAVGYLPAADTIAVERSGQFRLKVSLQDHMLPQVNVTEDRVSTIQQSREKLSQNDLNAVSGRSLGDVLQAVNGVSVLSNGPTISKPVIHGLHSNRIVLINNGIRQEDQQWGGEHSPNVDPFVAGSITVIKGAAGVRYGTDAIGGVILIDPAPVRAKAGWGGELNLGGFSNNRMGVVSGMIEHRSRKIPALSFRVQGTLKKGGNYRIPDYWVANTGVMESNYSATAGYHKRHFGVELFYSHFNTQIGVYRGSHTGNRDDLMNAIRSPSPLVPAGFTYTLERPRQHVSHDLFKARFYAETRAGVLSLVWGHQHNFRQEYDVVRTENGKAQLNLTLNTQTLNINLDLKPLKRVTGQVGIDGIYQENFFRNGDRLSIPTYTSLGAGSYLIERYKKGRLSLEAGLRYDYRWYGVYNPEGNDQHLVYHEFAYNNVSGTVGISQQLRSNWSWSATLANAWRAPQANELFSAGLHHGAARVEIGNKSLQPEQSYGVNLESEYRFNRRFSVDVSLYSQLINHFIYLEPGADMLTIRGYFKTFHYRQTNAWLSGSDVSFYYQPGRHLKMVLKGALISGRDRSRRDWLILMPSNRVSFNARYERDLSTRFRDCFIGAEARYVFQQTRIPSYFDQVDYPRPPEGYFLVDMSAGGRINIRKQPVYLSVSVANLLNTRYREYLDVFRYFIDQPGTNVMLRIRVPFNLSNNQN